MHDLRRELSKESSWHTFVTICMKIAFDFYLTNKCLKYEADAVATAVIQAALYYLGIDISDEDCYLKNWIKVCILLFKF